jgi:hypothetical protein
MLVAPQLTITTNIAQAIRRSKSCRSRTKLIIFLGTPHRGSQYARWEQIEANLARVVLQDSNMKMLQSLIVDGELLNNINEEFKDLAQVHRIRIHSFQEGRGISGVKGLHNKVRSSRLCHVSASANSAYYDRLSMISLRNWTCH